MKHLLPAIALMCSLPWAAHSQSAAAIEDSDRDDPRDYYSALTQMQDDAFALDIETQREEAVQKFLEIADEAEAARKRFADEPNEVRRFTEAQGIALYYAAEYHLFDSANAEARTREISWLLEGIGAFESIPVDDATTYFPFYEYEGSASLLFEHGAWLGDSRLPDWSRSKVRAARGKLKQNGAASTDPGAVVFETNALAQALFEYGFLTGDQASIDEANAILEKLGEDNIDYYSADMRDAVAEGRAPFPAPGEEY